jgi:hypothetical protein
MKERITITIKDLDDIQNVLKSLELLFTKLIYYYEEKDMNKLITLVLSCSVWFGKILQILGINKDNLKEF